jgi:hypothetical protein
LSFWRSPTRQSLRRSGYGSPPKAESRYGDGASAATKDPPTNARILPLVAFFLPLTVFLIGFRYVGSGDTEPAELLPISLLSRGSLDFNEFVSGRDLPYPYRRIGGVHAIFEARDAGPTDHALAVELRDPRGAVRRLGPIRFRWAR